jgi:dUTP pyrophosphatase
MNMKVAIINKSTNQLPQYETPASAGMDIRADFSRVSIDNPIKVWGESEIIFAGEAHSKTLLRLEPGSRALIPTGMFTAIPVGYEVQLRPRSGLAIKSGQYTHVGTLDENFRGECAVILYNLSDEPFEIKQGDRIGQAVLSKYTPIEWETTTTLEASDRGENGFGSSGV